MTSHRALIKRQPDIIVERVAFLMATQTQAIQPQRRDDDLVGKPEDAEDRPKPASEQRQPLREREVRAPRQRLPSAKSSFLGSFSFVSSTGAFAARIQSPVWLSRRALDVHYSASYSGWKIRLRPWTRQPASSEVFQFVEKNDIAGMQRLFESGEASPYDRDQHGWTLLHVRYFYKRPSVLLLAQC